MFKKQLSPETEEATAVATQAVAETVVETTQASTEPVSIDKANMAQLAKDLGIESEIEQKTTKEIAVPDDKKVETATTNDGKIAFAMPEKKIEKFQDYENWTKFGRSMGLEVKEDTEASFQEALKAQKEIEKLEATKELKDLTLRKELEKYDPETQAYFDFIANGGKAENFANPLKPFEKYLAMDNDDLVRENLKLNNVDESQIDAEITKLTEDGTLDSTAAEIRNYIIEKKEETQKNIVEQQKNIYQKSYQIETNRISKALDNIDTFMDIELPKELKKTIQDKIPALREKIKNDDKLAAEVMIFLELGDQAKELVRKKGYDEARNKFHGKLHNLENLPEIKGNTASRVDVNTGKSIAELWAEGLK